jgi:dCTP deaminase
VILSNIGIYEALDLGRIVLKPEPSPRLNSPGGDSPYSTHAVDVRLGKYPSIPRIGPYNVDLGKSESSGRPKSDFSKFLVANSDQKEIPSEGYELDRDKFVLAQTVEWLGLPVNNDANKILKRCIAARFEGKSGRARTGLLVHFTAPTIHPGLAGHITLEMINLGPVPFVLREGMAIGQLIFEEVEGLPIEKESQFQGQRRPEGNV